jgi:hypothetical protein
MAMTIGLELTGSPCEMGSSAAPGRTRAFGLSQHADQHRSERPVLLAVDQQFGERLRLGLPIKLADLSCALGVG